MKKQLLKSAIIAVAGVGLLAGSAMALTFTTTTNKTNWLSIVDPTSSPTIPLVENFEDTTLLPGFSITEVNGAGTYHDGMYENIVDKDINRYQVYTYAPGMWAFGGEFNLADPGGQGTSIDIYVNNIFVMNIPSSAQGNFYGFYADGAFNSVEFRDADQNGAIQETYYSVDISLAPVPEPATMLLFGTGLAGLAGIARRKKVA